MFAALNFDFLLEGILLGLVVHVPAEGEPEFVYEVAAGLLFLIICGQVEFLVGPKIGHKLLDLLKCLVESRWHLSASVRRSGAGVNATLVDPPSLSHGRRGVESFVAGMDRATMLTCRHAIGKSNQISP